MKTIAIDLGGSRVKMGVVDDGKVVRWAMVESNSQAGLKPLLPKIEEVCRQWAGEYSIQGLGIAFHAKPKVKATAEQSISTIGLDGILYFLGYKDSYLEN